MIARVPGLMTGTQIRGRTASSERDKASRVTDVVSTLWSFCHTLRHDGMDHADYVEQLTYLLFLKMADEQTIALPEGASWDSLRAAGPKLREEYVRALQRLGKGDRVLRDIFQGAESHFRDDANLRRLLDLIDDVAWTGLGVDVQGAAFEGLLEKAASAGKKGAGQYFTPRPLVDAIVRCLKPKPTGLDFRLTDPACGTGGFLVAAYEWFSASRARGTGEALRRMQHSTYYGQEIVARPRRLALMNLYLRGIDARISLGDAIYGPPPHERFDIVLTNPPFGSKGVGSVPSRADFTVRTSSKQLNFLQHVRTILKPTGRAAVVLPDSALFTSAGIVVLRELFASCDVHTVLRLPRGTFAPYTSGTAANVVFFNRAGPTRETWIYDARLGAKPLTKRARPLVDDHFAEFERCFGEDPAGHAPRSHTDAATGRWRRFTTDDVVAAGYRLDSLRWMSETPTTEALLDDEARHLLATAKASLQEALDELANLEELLGAEPLPV
jgi:type I restriction enzyme M protein